EAARLRPRRDAELLRDEGREPARAGDLHRAAVVIHAHAASTQVLEVPADAAADLEHEAELEAAEVRAVRALDVEQPLPPGALRPPPLLGVPGVLRAHLKLSPAGERSALHSRPTPTSVLPTRDT